MSRRRALLLLVAWVGLAGVTGFQLRRAAAFRADLAKSLAENNRLDSEKHRFARELDTLKRELVHAEQQLAALPAENRDPAAATDSRQVQVEAWRNRLQTLRGRFAERPEQRIPEMALLTEEDWLRASLLANFDTEEGAREAMARVRSAAVAKVSDRLIAASKRYLEAHGLAKPADLRPLAAYIEPPLDSSVLVRYHVVDQAAAGTTAGRATWAITLKAPIDPDFDSRPHVRPSGGYQSSSGILAWDEALMERYRRAVRDYRGSHQGSEPRSFGATLPYFNPPLEPELAQRLLKYDRQ